LQKAKPTVGHKVQNLLQQSNLTKLCFRKLQAVKIEAEKLYYINLLYCTPE